MLRKGLVIALVVGLVAAGIAIARDGGRPSRSEPFTPLPGHSVTRPSKTVGAASTRTPPLRKVVYLESSKFNVPPEGGPPPTDKLVATKCPRRSVALNGYFTNDKPGLVLDFTAIAVNSVRKWEFGLLNTTTENRRASVGVVCIK